MFNAHHVMSYVQFLERKVVHQEERINILQRLNRHLVQEYARLRTEQKKAALRKESERLVELPKPKKKKQCKPRKDVAVYDGYRQLEVKGEVYYVSNLRAALKMNKIKPNKGLQRLREKRYLDENNIPSPDLLQAEYFLVTNSQAYAHKAGVKWIGDKKAYGLFNGCIMEDKSK